MRTVLFYFVCFFSCVQLTQAQSSIGVTNDLKGINATNATNVAISTFNNGAIKGSRYLFDDWTGGSIIASNGEVYSQSYGFNFDKIKQDVYAKDNNSGVTVVLDKTKIKRFKIGNSTFVQLAQSNGRIRNGFYQLLAEDSSKISLYKFTATKFVQADASNIMNARTGNSQSEYVDDITYYVSNKGGDLKKVSLNENNIRKTLKEKADKVDAYLNMNSTKEVDEAFLVNLIRYVNE